MERSSPCLEQSLVILQNGLEEVWVEFKMQLLASGLNVHSQWEFTKEDFRGGSHMLKWTIEYVFFFLVTSNYGWIIVYFHQKAELCQNLIS